MTRFLIALLAVLLAAELGTDWTAASHPAMWLIYLLVGLGLGIIVVVAWLFASCVWVEKPRPAVEVERVDLERAA